MLASASTAARADNSDQQLIAVVYANGGQQTYPTIVSSLTASCPTAGETLAEHGPGGELLTPQQVTGWPVGTLIDECLGIPSALAAAVTDVVDRAGIGPARTDPGSQLTPDDWQPGDFARSPSSRPTARTSTTTGRGGAAPTTTPATTS